MQFVLNLVHHDRDSLAIQVHSSASKDAVSSVAAGPYELETTVKYEETSTTPDSATAVMHTNSLCFASPRSSDHLKQGPTLMIVSSLPLEQSCEQLQCNLSSILRECGNQNSLYGRRQSAERQGPGRSDVVGVAGLPLSQHPLVGRRPLRQHSRRGR